MNNNEKKKEYTRLYKKYIREFWLKLANPSLYFNKQLLRKFTLPPHMYKIDTTGRFLYHIIRQDMAYRPEYMKTADRMIELRKDFSEEFIKNPIQREWNLYKNHLLFTFHMKFREHYIRIRYNRYTQDAFMRNVSELCYIAYKIAFIDQSFEISVKHEQERARFKSPEE